MKKNDGFTLVEIIVVIAIITILVLSAFPRLHKYVEYSIDTTELSNARTLYTGSVAAIVSETAKFGNISVDWQDDTFDALQITINANTNITNEIKLKTYATFDSVIYFANDVRNHNCWLICYGVNDSCEFIDPSADIYIVAPDDTIYQNGIKQVDY